MVLPSEVMLLDRAAGQDKILGLGADAGRYPPAFPVTAAPSKAAPARHCGTNLPLTCGWCGAWDIACGRPAVISTARRRRAVSGMLFPRPASTRSGRAGRGSALYPGQKRTLTASPRAEALASVELARSMRSERRCEGEDQCGVLMAALMAAVAIAGGAAGVGAAATPFATTAKTCRHGVGAGGRLSPLRWSNTRPC